MSDVQENPTAQAPDYVRFLDCEDGTWWLFQPHKGDDAEYLMMGPGSIPEPSLAYIEKHSRRSVAERLFDAKRAGQLEHMRLADPSAPWRQYLFRSKTGPYMIARVQHDIQISHGTSDGPGPDRRDAIEAFVALVGKPMRESFDEHRHAQEKAERLRLLAEKTIAYSVVDDDSAIVAAQMMVDHRTELDSRVATDVQETTATILEGISLPNREYFVNVVTVDGEIAGVIAINRRFATYAGGVFGQITEFYVKPEFRKQELGRAMLIFAADEVRSLGWKSLEVGALSENIYRMSRWFYESAGFKVLGPRLSMSL